ncbi:MAG: GTPase [Planctomycetaceae bacterium]|nr:GTPase [Planctomycetaceae bacterium]
MTTRLNCIIMGAAGRDFHDCQTFFRSHPQFKVRAFTAAQIPFIDTRTFPASLAGPDYDDDIPIFPEDDLPSLIARFAVDFVFLAYSDLPHVEVMHKASLVQACGASFALLGPRQTQLESTNPVISVTAVRTGAGKSPLTQWLAGHLVQSGRRVGVLRHPMPYGDLKRQRVERFATQDDLDRYDCTVEEREEYEPYIEQGLVIFAGVDYEAILRQAEAEADVILWDGGNNDSSFIRPGLSIVVADALRPGHELKFYPGETNVRGADVVVINKVAQARAEDVRSIRANIRDLNPNCEIAESDLTVQIDDPECVAGRRVLVVEDGPTLTHGGMSYGAGLLAARKFNAGDVIDPRRTAVGSIREALAKYPHVTEVLPALGYSSEQRDELTETINASSADLVIDASPAGLDGFLDLKIPTVRVRYVFQQTSGRAIEEIAEQFLKRVESTGELGTV